MSLLFPTHCILCGQTISEQARGLCKACRAQIETEMQTLTCYPPEYVSDLVCAAQYRGSYRAALLLALLCPLMLIFIALPMRQSTAEAMQLFLSGAPMATVAMLPLNGYWKKVVRSLRMTGLMLLWLLPFAVMPSAVVLPFAASTLFTALCASWAAVTYQSPASIT